MNITKHILFATIATAAIGLGCEDHNRATERPATAARQPMAADKAAEPMASPSPMASAEATAAASPEASPMASAVPADNTGKNERDRDPNKLTPMDQKENETDLTITQKVRQEVVGRDALSMTAKNVKIITVDGVVTLRGPVNSDGEKREVASIAQRVMGVKRVDNQLEVASK